MLLFRTLLHVRLTEKLGFKQAGARDPIIRWKTFLPVTS